MKKDIHPDYRRVVFRDKSGDFSFLTGSTRESNETIEWHDGNTYPVVDVEISSATPPVLHGPAARDGHPGPGGEVQEALRPEVTR